MLHWRIRGKVREGTFRRFFALLKRYVGLLFNAVLCLTLLSFLKLATPWGMAIIIDNAIPEGNAQLIILIVIALLLIALFTQVFSYLSDYLVRYVGQRLMFDLRMQLFRHVQSLSLRFYDERKTGEILSRLTSDVASFQRLITGNALSLAGNLVMFVGILILIFLLHWKLAIVSILVFPFHILTYAFFHDRVWEANKKWREKWSEIHGSATEVLSAAKLVKSFSAEGRENIHFVRDIKEDFDLRFDMGTLSKTWDLTSTFFLRVGRTIVLGYGAWIVITDPSWGVGRLVAFLSYNAMLYEPVMQLTQSLTHIVPAMTGIERVFEYLDIAPDVQEVENPLVLDHIDGKVEFRDVRFSYTEDQEVLHGVSFSAEPGEIMALVGPSGSGKSTIANLITRFYDVQSGEILIDGHNIKELKLKPYRDQIGMVLQETVLFSGTVEENIRYGKPGATREEVEEAARMANAHDFIINFPDGYKSEVGENGVKISGGQRQRIAIARAILRDPKILILDEATSSLDTASELLIQEALERLMVGRTTFIIAHRLSTIKSADKIVVILNGVVKQTGTHEELLKQDGIYRKLYRPESVRKEDIAKLDLLQVA